MILRDESGMGERTFSLLNKITRHTAALAMTVLALGCEENVVAPAVCPEYCPATTLEVLDTLFTTAIVMDSTYDGYVLPDSSRRIQVGADSTLHSYGVYRFHSFPDTILDVNDFNRPLPVVGIDSFLVSFVMNKRSADTAGPVLPLHALPSGADVTPTYEDLVPYFDDSTRIGEVELVDSVTSGRISAVLPGDAFGILTSDSSATVAVAYESAESGFVNLVTRDSTLAATYLVRYAKVDSADGALAERNDTISVQFDTFVFPPPPPRDPAALVVGGAPSARTLLRVDLPTQIVDSASVVRATLLLVPTEPVYGLRGDSVLVQTESLAIDVGAKSPVVLASTDSLGIGNTLVPVGWADTVSIDVSDQVRVWKPLPNLPHTISLRVSPEGMSVAEFRFNSSRSATGTPLLRITYVPPVVEQGGR
jgi:hypothetical protein